MFETFLSLHKHHREGEETLVNVQLVVSTKKTKKKQKTIKPGFDWGAEYRVFDFKINL